MCFLHMWKACTWVFRTSHLLRIHMCSLLKTRISHAICIIIDKYYIAHAVLRIIPTRSSFRNVIPMCSVSDFFTSLYMTSISTHLSLNPTRLIQNSRPTVFLRTPMPNQTSLTKGAVTHAGLLCMSSAMVFYLLAYLWQVRALMS